MQGSLWCARVWVLVRCGEDREEREGAAPVCSCLGILAVYVIVLCVS